MPRRWKRRFPLAHATPQDHLDGVHAAGVVLRDAHHLLIRGEAQVQQLDGVQGGLEADGQAAALMAVEGRALFPKAHARSYVNSPF